ncbi:MAG: NDP-sugar synthase [Elusimicrobia bacterium]|nr:NDP-sugar synthase [Elusimicrobiota bacterium]
MADLGLKAMILAAGAGTRLRPITYETPKPMVPVVNRPVIHHVLDNLLKHGVRSAMVNLHAHAEQIQGYCGDGSRWSIKLQYSKEPKLLGTAGAIKRVERFFSDGPFVVMSGDGVSDIDLTALFDFHRRKRSLATMVLKAVDTRFDYGVTMTDPSGRITGFLEKPSWSDVFSNKANTGIYLFEPEVFRYIPKNRFYDFGHELWPKLLKARKRIFAYEMKSYWTDVGNLAEYRKSQIDALEGSVVLTIPGREVRKGVWIEEGTVIRPGAVLKAPCLIGKGCVVEAGAQVGPHTVIGDRGRISSQAVLKNCILFENVTVGRNVHLSNCILGANGNVQENITVYEAAVLNIRQ